MAPALLKRIAWAGACAVALAVLIFSASFGTRENTAMVAFKAAGLMVALDPATITDIEIDTGTRHRRFIRDASGWRDAHAPSALAGDATAQIATALNLLHGSAPERVLAGDELGSVASFGLAPPVLHVAVKGAQAFSVSFGVANPMGLARYARVDGQAEVALLPGYVAEAWEQVAGLQ